MCGLHQVEDFAGIGKGMRVVFIAYTGCDCDAVGADCDGGFGHGEEDFDCFA